MACVKADKRDDNDRLIRRFLKKVKKEEIIEEVQKRQHFVKPSIAKRIKSENAERERKKEERKLRKQNS